jgi:hypothetical protein
LWVSKADAPLRALVDQILLLGETGPLQLGLSGSSFCPQEDTILGV